MYLMSASMKILFYLYPLTSLSDSNSYLFDWQTPDEVRKEQQPKCCDTSKDEDVSPHINPIYNGNSSFQKFKEKSQELIKFHFKN